MVPSSFTESNGTLDPPIGVDLDDCEVLSIFRGQLPNKQPVVISCWKLTKEELEEVTRTGRVWLVIWGQTMPPVYISGEKVIK